MSKSDKIAFVVVMSILTLMAMFLMSAAVTLKLPSNGGPVILTFVDGVALGMYMISFIVFRKDK